MLRKTLCILGALCLLAAAAALLTGAGAVFVPQLLLSGLILLVGLAVERWRYKPVRRQRIDPGWQDTGERFVDPETGAITAVYFDPLAAERHYIAVENKADGVRRRPP